MPVGSFADSNVLLYLVWTDVQRSARVKQIARGRLVISTQVLNEIANVMRRKWKRSWDETNAILGLVRQVSHVRALDVATHDLGVRIAQRYQLSIYDGMIVAAALLADCETLYSEDMQHGLVVDDRLRIVNPFRET